MWMKPNRRVVQTELDQGDYETLVQIAKSRGMSIKDAAREALRLWSVSLANLEEDPLFRLEPVEFKTKIRSDQIEGFLYKR